MRLDTMSFSDFTKEKNLILTVNKHGEIIQFDIECQKITGFSREEAINKKIWDLLIPYPYIKQWKKMMVSSFLEDGINDIRIPWKTKQGTEVLIILNSFPFKDKTGTADNVCFMGKKISNVWNKKQNDGIKNEKISYKGGDKMTEEATKPHFVFTKPPLSQRKIEVKKNNNKNRQKPLESSRNQYPMPLTKNTDHQELSIKNQKQLTKKIQELSEKYDEILKKQKILIKSNRKLERKNKQLTKKITKHHTEIETPKKQLIENQLKKSDIKDASSSSTKTSDKTKKRNIGIGWKKKKIEYENNIQTLKEMEKKLDFQQQKLHNERKDFDKRISKLSTWKEKLQQLEEEIEKRRVAVVEKEEKFQEQILHQQQETDIISTEHDPEKSIQIVSDQQEMSKPGEDYFNTITKSAGLIQRGIFKQVNDSFVTLLGYSIDEIMDKSIIDFIAPEGLQDIENYYISKLKGIKETTFQTVFLTKDNVKIPVKVEVESVKFHGSTAEIAIVENIESNKKEE